MRVDEILDRLDGVAGSGPSWKALCPVHGDRHQSLSITETDDGVVLLKCHAGAGCEVDAICAEIGIELRDLFNDHDRLHPGGQDVYYQYEDLEGNVRFEVVRTPDKRFFQRHYDPDHPKAKQDGWVWNLDGVERIPYGLRELVQGVNDVRWIFIVEGEKDVEAIRRAGGVATCNPGGAGRGKWDPAWNEYLRGAYVIIVADRDTNPKAKDAGVRHAEALAEQLRDVAASVEIRQARAGKDAYDHLTAGYGLEDFVPFEQQLDGIVLVSVGAVDEGDVEWVTGFDGWVPYGGISILLGMPGTNKSTLTCALAAQLTSEGHGAVFVATEDSIAQILKPRLWVAGADVDRCFFVSKREDGFEGLVLLPHDIRDLEAAMKDKGARLLVIDPIDAHIGSDIDANKGQSIRSALAPLAMMAERNGFAVVAIQHENKTRSQNAMIRAGGNIAIPGIARCGLLMANDPDAHELEGKRVLASFKNNWGQKPKSRQYSIETSFMPGIETPHPRLSYRGETWMTSEYLLRSEYSKDKKERS